jgi:hypothetical protein
LLFVALATGRWNSLQAIQEELGVLLVKGNLLVKIPDAAGEEHPAGKGVTEPIVPPGDPAGDQRYGVEHGIRLAWSKAPKQHLRTVLEGYEGSRGVKELVA